MKRILPFLLLLFAATAGMAQTVTYSEHVAPIIYNHCTSCHRTGEIAPFALTNYGEVQTHAQMIAYATSIKFMPPWKADPAYQHYQRENTLTAAEIQTLQDWVAGGTPQGNPALEPALPVFPMGSQIGQPDVSLHFTQSYKHVGNGTDEYHYFVLPTGLTQDRNLVALEVRPGNKRVMHHALVWSDTTGSAAAADAATPEYGYAGNVNSTLAEIDGQLPGYVPGTRPVIYQNGIVQRLKAGADLKIQVHYAPSAVDEWDSTTVNLFFAQPAAPRYVKSHVMIPFFGTLINGPFTIPANQVREFHGKYTFTEKVSLLNISPHCHKLGQTWHVFAVTPAGDTTHLVKINDWDFNWQGAYSFTKPLVLPQGTVVHAYAKYDNTTANANNPNSPPQTISWGEKTSDEMYYLPFSWVSYQSGDENINFETTVGTNDASFHAIPTRFYPIAPNPAADAVKVGFTLAETGKATLRINDMQGREVETIFTDRLHYSGLFTYDIDLSRLSIGLYVVTLEVNGVQYPQKLAVVR